MNKTTVKLALSGLGAFLGLFAFVVFFFIYGNNRAGVWALFSGESINHVSLTIDQLHLLG
jgi:hypothetical protein